MFHRKVFLVHALKSGCTAYSLSMHSFILSCGYIHSMKSIFTYVVGSMYTVLYSFSMHTHSHILYDTGSIQNCILAYLLARLEKKTKNKKQSSSAVIVN